MVLVQNNNRNRNNHHLERTGNVSGASQLCILTMESGTEAQLLHHMCSQCGTQTRKHMGLLQPLVYMQKEKHARDLSEAHGETRPLGPYASILPSSHQILGLRMNNPFLFFKTMGVSCSNHGGLERRSHTGSPWPGCGL